MFEANLDKIPPESVFRKRSKHKYCENIASIIEPRMRMMMGDMDLCKIGGGVPALVYQVAERSWQREG